MRNGPEDFVTTLDPCPKPSSVGGDDFVPEDFVPGDYYYVDVLGFGTDLSTLRPKLHYKSRKGGPAPHTLNPKHWTQGVQCGTGSRVS